MKLVRDVLIGFVTTSDPATSRGPANIITVAKAKLPQVIYLLYTKETRGNRDALLQWLKLDPELARATVPNWPELDLPDVTDYARLASLLSEELKKIDQQHQGAHFHLVSGLPQARIVFALCLSAGLLTNGTLYEVKDQAASRTYQPPQQVSPQPLDHSACNARLKEWPIAIFKSFQEMFRERMKSPRLVFDLATHTVKIGEAQLDVRSREGWPRRFLLLLVLAARKRYGAGQEIVTKADLKEFVYRGVARKDKHIPEAIKRINAKAKLLTQNSPRPLNKLIKDVKQNGRSVGHYKLTDDLNPAHATIVIHDLSALRKALQALFGKKRVAELFPDLPQLPPPR